ncbi:MAG: hypothetical protein ABI231_08680 [Candidatus Tumulicola sp.]
MKISRSVAYALGVGVTVAALTACNGGGLTQSTPSSGAQPNGVVAGQRHGASPVAVKVGIPHPLHGKSRVKAGKGAPLLYVSDYVNAVVNVYSWPGAKLVGTLYGTGLPRGMCADKAHNIWITDATGSVALYPHGATSPTTVLTTPGYDPVACAVNPKTGDLAVSNIQDASGAQGSLMIFAHGSGSPTTYFDPAIYYYDFLGYDNKGNLFIDGQDGSLGFQLAEFSNGSFTPITVSGATINFPGGVQYVRGTLTVGDQAAAGGSSIVYQMSASGQVSGSTTLSGSQDCVQYYVSGGSIVCPNAGGPTGPNASVYHYAGGGVPTASLDGSYMLPLGAVISK